MIQLEYLVSKRPRWTWDIIPTSAEYFKLFQLSPGLLLGGQKGDVEDEAARGGDEGGPGPAGLSPAGLK